MRILLLSYFYTPDIGPGSSRSKSLIDALIGKGSTDLKIDVMTTMPNRYPSLNIDAKYFERNRRVSIYRIKLPKHRNGKFDQIKAFISYSLKVRKLTSKKKWDIVIATSGRLMTASLGTWVAKQTGSKLYLDIRDIFTDTISSIFAKKPVRMLMPIFILLEKWTFCNADKINLVSAGFLDHFKKITPNLTPSIYTNGIDEIFLKKDFFINDNKNKNLILYAGNFGEGQGLHNIIPEAANKFKDIQFRLIGDGPERKSLKENKLFKLQKNIEIINPIIQSELINEYQKADILFVHLNDYKAFKKSLPSKIFEYVATGKPILAGVSGYAAEFLNNQVQGVEVFKPGDVEAMKQGLQKLLKGPKFFDRSNFCHSYSRKNIMEKMAFDILSLS